MYLLGKILEALGMASLALGVLLGINGDMKMEYYLFFGGLVFFFAGRFLEKKFGKK